MSTDTGGGLYYPDSASEEGRAMTKRIRWESAPSYSLAAFAGRTGSNDADMFKIFTPDIGEPDWILNSALPGWDNRRGRGGGPEELEAEAERWLEEFVSSLGAVFPDPELPECHRCEKPVTGTPVTDPEDPMGREFCSGECLDSAAEQAGGAFADIEYSTEFD